MAKDFSNVNKNTAYSSRRATALATPPATVEQTAPAIETTTEAPRRENYSRHLQSLLKPSTHEALTRIAKSRAVSVNGLVNEILEQYIKEH